MRHRICAIPVAQAPCFLWTGITAGSQYFWIDGGGVSFPSLSRPDSVLARPGCISSSLEPLLSLASSLKTGNMILRFLGLQPAWQEAAIEKSQRCPKVNQICNYKKFNWIALGELWMFVGWLPSGKVKLMRMGPRPSQKEWTQAPSQAEPPSSLLAQGIR